ncbi:kelch repeat-containing protein, partial [Bacteroidota bacterium]
NELQPQGTLPNSRTDHSAIYDMQNKRMVIFGGWSSVVYNSLNDVWSYNIAANTWTQISTSGGSPSNRAGHVAIYDNTRHRMVVFAGSNWWQAWYNDTWALDLTTNIWSQLSTTGGPPTNRYFHSGVYDSIQDRLLIFGGVCGSTSSNWKSNETWALNFTTLQWQQLNTTNNPSPREETSAIFDATNNRMIIFGGRNGTNYGDVQALNLSTLAWSYLGNFSDSVSCHRAVYDPQKNWMIVAAGWGLYNHGQAAVFSLNNDTWLNVSITGTIPPLRQNPSLIWDPVGQRALLFGGDPGPLTADFNDTWEFIITVPVGINDSKNYQLIDANLYQNYPNPFYSTTIIEYLVNQSSNVELKIYNALGQLVKTLVDDYKTIGEYSVEWEGTDNFGQSVPLGIYIYQIKIGNFVFAKKMILTK